MHDFQKKFLDVILGAIPSESFLEGLKPVGKLSSKDVIQVYRQDYSARLEEALGKNFEATWLLLGDEDFHQLAQSYIKVHPSDLKNLTIYGEHFPDFLKTHEVEKFIVEMALFEKNFWRLFHHPPVKPRPVTQEEFSTRIFKMKEDAYLSHSEIRLFDLWSVRESTGGELSLSDFEEEEFLVMFRSDSKVEVKRLNKSQYRVLSLVSELSNLEAVFEALESDNEKTAQEDWPLIFEVLSYFV